MTRNAVDAIVIGAGPAGATAARVLKSAGARVLILERKKLPRHKNCSGLIAHDAQDMVERHFGPIPQKLRSRTGDYTGIALHFPSAPSVTHRLESPVPNVWRKDFDQFLVEGSGADVADEVKVEDIAHDTGEVTLTASHAGRRISFSAPYVIAADGGESTAVRRLSPGLYRCLRWAFAYQRYYRGSIDLDRGSYHAFFFRNVGINAWVTFKDDFILVGLGVYKGQKIAPYYSNLLDLLTRRHGLRAQGSHALAQGSWLNDMAPFHRFFFGRGAVLVAGEAAGLLHMGAEGISAAVASGAIAGACVAGALEAGGSQHLVRQYQTMIQPEVVRTQDQWNLLRMNRSATLRTLKPESALKEPLNSVRRLRDLYRFIGQDTSRSPGLGAAIARHTLVRAIMGRYEVSYA